MMQSYPFFNFPFYRRNYNSYTNYQNYAYNTNKSYNKSTLPLNARAPQFQNTKSQVGESQNYRLNSNVTKNEFANKKNNAINKDEFLGERTNTFLKDDTFFEIFGIKLHFDDILLICLILFLFQEGVQDQYLFFTLVLLLLS